MEKLDRGDFASRMEICRQKLHTIVKIAPLRAPRDREFVRSHPLEKLTIALKRAKHHKELLFSPTLSGGESHGEPCLADHHRTR